MKKENVIGLIYRFDKNDYQISLMDFSEEDQNILQNLMMNMIMNAPVSAEIRN